jgi:predicted ATPase
VTGRYQFRHALYQQVLYDRVPAGRRVHLHRQIGMREEAAFGAQAGERAAVLAMHFDRGHDYPRAIRYLQQAAENALRRHAAREAITHLTMALKLVPSLPNTAERAQRELALQIALGPALMVTQGYAAPAVGQTYARARALCQEMEQTVQLVPSLRGLWLFYLARAELHTVRELAAQLFRLAQDQLDPWPLVEAHNALGTTFFCVGEGLAARQHLEQGIALATAQQHRSSVRRYGQDLGIRGLSYLALTLWLLGYADQALQRSQEALTLAQERAHPFTLASALYFAAKLHQFRRETFLTQEQAEAVNALATEHGFNQRLAVGTIQRGWALAVQGQGEAGLAQIRQGLEAHRATGTDLGQPYRLALLAEAAGCAGQADEGLRVLAEALALVEHTGERQWEAELYRLKGALLLSYTAGVGFPATLTEEAETCFQRAVDIARQQHAKALELRAATSLARLWQQQGQQAAARALLAPIYGWFTEGFDTADLQEASALLQEPGKDITAGHSGRMHSNAHSDNT